MNSLKVILLIVQTAIYFQPGWSHKCFVCGPEGGKPEDLYQLKKSFPNMVVPSCSKYKQSNKDQYLIDCPPGLSTGCLTKFEENGSIIMCTCAPIAIEDCKKANGINYCYCKKEGCNTPERSPLPGSTSLTEESCQQKQEEMESCKLEAYEEYKKAVRAGEDGRPDWMARTSCRYLTSTLGDCSEKLRGCNTTEEINKARDETIPTVLEQLYKVIKEWDSEKCQIIADHLERMSRPEEKVSMSAHQQTSSTVEGKSKKVTECDHPKGLNGESYTQGCVRHTCKKGVWRVSLDLLQCCYQGESFSPNSEIASTTTSDGSSKATINCLLNGDTAEMVLTVENLSKPASKHDVEDFKRMLESYRTSSLNCTE